MRKRYTRSLRSVVIKVGTSILTRNGRFDKKLVGELANQTARLLKKGIRVSIVSSGAIGSGMIILKHKKRPTAMEGLQAAAAIGQRYLMQCYEEAFARHGFTSAQVLLTWDDLAKKDRFLNAKRTLKEIQRLGAVPIINENDTVATEEIRFGDNDRLSALLSILLETDLLIILTDTDGIYADTDAGCKSRIPIVPRLEDSFFKHVKDSKTKFTIGGMRSKLEAVRMCVGAGIPVFLARGRQYGILSKIVAGEDVGTFFVPHLRKSEARDNWIVHFQNHILKRQGS